MIEPRMKHIALGLVLIVSILAAPGDRIPNHPNCPEHEGPRPVYFVHPTNCSRFYECKQKDAWEFECARGLHFNSKIDVCDYPVNAQCEPQSSATTTNQPTTLVTSTTTTPNTTPTTTVATTPEIVPTIPSTTTTTSAPPPSVVPTTTTTSAPPPSVVPTTITTSAPPPTAVTTTPSYTTPDDSTTPSYPTPDVPTPTTSYTTPDDYTTSHPTSDATTTYRPPQSGVTPMPNCPPFGATQPNYWADNSDCSRYLGCLENCVQKFKCPDGLYWNDLQKRCDSFGNSHCCPVIPPAPNEWSTTVQPGFSD